MSDSRTAFLTLDHRRQLPLGRHLPKDAPSSYQVEFLAGGQILLSPARVVTEEQFALMQNRPDIISDMLNVARTGELPPGSGPRRR